MRVMLAVGFVLLIAAMLSGVARADYVGGLEEDGYDYLTLRSGPGRNFSEIDRLGPNTVVDVIARDGRWRLVRLQDGTTGWVHSRYLRPGSPPAPRGFRRGDLIVVSGLSSGGRLSFRDGPGTNYFKRAEYPEGTVFIVLSLDGGWVKVVGPNDQIGYVSGRFVSPRDDRAQPDNVAPVVSIGDQTVEPEQWVDLSSVISVSDANGDPITRYQLWDDTGFRNWWVRGVGQVDAANGYTVRNLDGVRFGGDPNGSSQTLRVRASDGKQWGAWHRFTLTTTPRRPVPKAAGQVCTADRECQSSICRTGPAGQRSFCVAPGHVCGFPQSAGMPAWRISEMLGRQYLCTTAGIWLPLSWQ